MNELEPTDNVAAEPSKSEFNSIDDIPYEAIPLEDVQPFKGKIIFSGELPLIPYPEDDYDPVGDLDYISPPPLETFKIRVKIVSITDGEPLPYPLDD